MENKVSFEQIDKLGDKSPVKAIWKGFLFHYYNNPKVILTALTLVLVFILLLIHPELLTSFAIVRAVGKLFNSLWRL